MLLIQLDLTAFKCRSLALCSTVVLQESLHSLGAFKELWGSVDASWKQHSSVDDKKENALLNTQVLLKASTSVLELK